MASLFAQSYIASPDYDKKEFPSKKDILLAQKSADEENEQSQKSKATARPEKPPSQVDTDRMRMMNNALWISELADELQLSLCVEAHCCSAGHSVRSEDRRNQGVI
jgi:hypothetical protein